MRTAHCLSVCCLQPKLAGAANFCLSTTGMMVMGLAIVAAVVTASPAPATRVLDCTSSGAGGQAEEGETRQAATGNARVLVDVPIGTVCVGPDKVEGEPSYVRRTRAPGGMAIVEVSTTPFMAELGSGDGIGQLIARPDQPASW